MTFACILLLSVVPLAASTAFSDFDLLQWGLAGLVASLMLVAALRGKATPEARSAPNRLSDGLAWLWGGLLVISLLAAVDHEAGLTIGLYEAARVATPLLIVAAFSARGLAAGTLDRLAMTGALGPALLLIVDAALRRGLWPLGVPHDGALTSTLGNPAFVGQTAALSLPFALHLLRGRKAAPATLIGALALVPALWLVIVTDARSAVLGAALAIVVWLGFSAPRRRIAFAAVAIGAFVGMMFLVHPSGAGRRLASIVDADHPTNRVRLELASDAWDMARSSPVFGVGGGRFADEAWRYRSHREWALSGLHSVPSDPHDEALRLVAEYGFVGALLALGTLVLLAWELRRRWASQDAEARARVRIAASALAAALPIALTWGLFLQPVPTIYFAAALGMGLCPATEKTPTKTPGVAHGIAQGLWLAAGLVATLVPAARLERDQAAVAWRDQLEAAKRGLVEDGPGPQTVARLAEAAQATRRLADSSLLDPRLRHRLHRALFNVAEQGRILSLALASQMAAETPRKPESIALQNALRAMPDLDDTRAALRAMEDDHPYHLPNLRLRAELERVADRNPECLGFLERSLEINPETPLVRTMMAAIHGEAKLQDRMLSDLEGEIALYPNEAETDLAWELLARHRGRQRELRRAVEVVDAWIEARGKTPEREALRGELTLYWGETRDSVGLFRSSPEELEDERREGALLAGAHEGLAAEARKPLLLARLGESPFDSATLEELRAVLESLQATTTGQAAADLDQLRGRVIARYRTIFAWEAHLTGDERLLRVHLRDARRMNPRSGDPWFLEVAHRLESGRRDEAVESVTGWKASAASATLPALTGVDGFSLIANHPAVLRALSTP